MSAASDKPKGPPAEMSAGELWVAITQTPRPHRLVDVPRNGADGKPVGQVAIWPLTQEELMVCQASADRVAKEALKQARSEGDHSAAYPDLYKNAAAVEVISRACRDPKHLEMPAFPSPKDIRRVFTADEISVLASMYAQLQYELGPIVADMSKDEMDAWLKKLAEGGARFPLAVASSAQLEALVLHSARRLYPSLTVTGSPGSPLEGGSPRSGEAAAAAAETSDDAFRDEFAGK